MNEFHAFQLAALSFMFIFLFYIIAVTLYSLKSPTHRVKRLAWNRYVLRLRGDTEDKTNNRHSAASSGELLSKMHVLRTILEALAHPIPFMISFSMMIQMILCGLISYEFLGQSGPVSAVITIGPLFAGSPLTAICLISYLYNAVDAEGLGSRNEIKSDILRTVCAGLLGLSALVAGIFRWKELVAPLCGCREVDGAGLDAETRRMNMMSTFAERASRVNENEERSDK